MQPPPASCLSAEKNLEAVDDALFVHSLQAMFFFGYCAANGEVHSYILPATNAPIVSAACSCDLVVTWV